MKLFKKTAKNTRLDNKDKLSIFREKNKNKTNTNKIEFVEEQLKNLVGGVKDNITHLKNVDFLGEGTYAFVKLAYDKHRKEEVALKIFEKKTFVIERRLKNFHVE